jgi:hypothetical protein
MRRRTCIGHPPRDLESRQSRHLHIQEYNVRLQPFDCAQRFDAVAGLADDLDAADLTQKISKFVARQLFIVDQHGSQIHYAFSSLSP